MSHPAERLAALLDGARARLAARAAERAAMMRRLRSWRKPPEAGIPAPATLPRGPRPMQGGAAARLDFEA